MRSNRVILFSLTELQWDEMSSVNRSQESNNPTPISSVACFQSCPDSVLNLNQLLQPPIPVIAKLSAKYAGTLTLIDDFIDSLKC